MEAGEAGGSEEAEGAGEAGEAREGSRLTLNFGLLSPSLSLQTRLGQRALNYFYTLLWHDQ